MEFKDNSLRITINSETDFTDTFPAKGTVCLIRIISKPYNLFFNEMKIGRNRTINLSEVTSYSSFSSIIDYPISIRIHKSDEFNLNGMIKNGITEVILFLKK